MFYFWSSVDYTNYKKCDVCMRKVCGVLFREVDATHHRLRFCFVKNKSRGVKWNRVYFTNFSLRNAYYARFEYVYLRLTCKIIRRVHGNSATTTRAVWHEGEYAEGEFLRVESFDRCHYVQACKQHAHRYFRGKSKGSKGYGSRVATEVKGQKQRDVCLVW